MAQDPMVEVFTELGIALFIIGFRIYARGRLNGFRKLQVDDYLMVLAGCIYSAEAAAAYYVNYFKGLSVDAMTDLQRASLDPSSREWSDRVNGAKIFILGWMTYTSLLWSLKACVVIFYFRITKNVQHMQLRLWIGAIAVGLTYVAMVIVILAACSPIEKHWQVNPDPGPQCHSPNPMSTLITLLIFNVTTDAYLIYIPIPMVWRSRIDLKRKLALTTLFAGAILTTIFGILRCVSILSAPGIAGAKAAGEWSVRESFVAVIVTNAPLIYPYVSRKWHALRSGYVSSKSSEQLQGYKLNHYDSAPNINKQASTHVHTTNKSRRGKKVLSPYSIPDLTQFDQNESEEHMVASPPRSTFRHEASDTLTGEQGESLNVYSAEIQGALRPPRPGRWQSTDNAAALQQQHQDNHEDQDRIRVTTSIQIDSAENRQKYERGQVGFY